LREGQQLLKRIFAQLLNNTLLALATGYVLFFFSERLFWSAFKSGDSVAELAVTWAAYCVVAHLFLSLVTWLRAYSADRVFLAGAVFGWLVEGTLVGTLYGTESSAPFPLSLLVTAVSWHALISVWVGWHFLRRSLQAGSVSKVVGWSIGLGLFWGTWATFLWRETPPVVVSPRAFAAHALAITAVLIAGYWLIARVGVATFKPRPLGLCLTTFALGTFYVQQVKALGIRPLVILPALVSLVVVVLWRAARKRPAEESPHATAAARPQNLACLFLMPVVATAVHAGLMRVEDWRRVPVPAIVFYGVTAPLSAVVLAWSIFRCATIPETREGKV
jgi:hypothetical protein